MKALIHAKDSTIMPVGIGNVQFYLKREGGQRLTERSVFKIIFVKLANFRANISEAQGDFLQTFSRSIGSVGKMLQWRSTTQ